MAREKKKPVLPGDMRMDSTRYLSAGEQPLTEEQRNLLKRGYDLFRFFYDQHKEEHTEIREARKMRRLCHDKKSNTSPAGSTLNSSIDNVIADQVDNMPEAVMVPEREETMDSAEEMTDVVSFVLYQSGWESKYQKLMEDAAVVGTGVAEIFWDNDAMGGEGMVNVLNWHPEDIFPDPQYENIQDGRAIFKVTHTTIAWVEEHYPLVKGYVREDEYTRQDEQAMVQTPEGDQKVTLIEFWYKRYDAAKRRYRVHMAQLAGGALLYSSELDFNVERKGEYAEGIYAHGQYPFIFYRYRTVPTRPFGTGLMHDYKDTQATIDRYFKYIDDNARASSKQRTFIRRNSGVNMNEVADMNRDFIEWEGNDIREVMQTIQAQPLNGQIYQMAQYLSETMKQDCGQNSFARGEGGKGVTAFTAVKALQDAGTKITRWHTASFKSAFREMIEQILWVLSEYMEPGRKLRIIGGYESSGSMKDRLIELVTTKAEGDDLPKPAYTVRVQVQRSSPEQIQSFNELLFKASEMCAQNGNPMPTEVILGLLQGYPNKGAILKAVMESSQIQQKLAQLEALNQQQAKTIEDQRLNIEGLERSRRTQGGASALIANGAAAPAQPGNMAIPAMKGGATA